MELPERFTPAFLWGKELPLRKIDAYVIPTSCSDWDTRGAWITYVDLNVQNFARTLSPGKRFHFEMTIYSPHFSESLSPGEQEKIVLETRKILAKYWYQLKEGEAIGSNLRKMFSFELAAYIFGLLTVATWWFIWFTQPYMAAIGIDNWFKYRHARKLGDYYYFLLAPGEEEKKIAAVNELAQYYQTLDGRYVEVCTQLRDYCREKMIRNEVFRPLYQAYQQVLKAEFDDSYVIKLIPTGARNISRFFLGPLRIEVPTVMVPTRNLEFKI